MTSSAVRAKLARLGMSQTALAAYLGVDPRTVRSWCAEPQRLAVPIVVQRLLDLMERCPDAWRPGVGREAA